VESETGCLDWEIEPMIETKFFKLETAKVH